MVIEINRDIEKYQETIVLGLTAKQLFFSIMSVVIGGGFILLLNPVVGLTMASYITIPIVAPIALSGFYVYHGMSFMEVMKKRWYFAFQNRRLLYRSTENDSVIREYQQEKNREKVKEKKKNGIIRRWIQRIKKSK